MKVYIGFDYLMYGSKFCIIDMVRTISIKDLIIVMINWLHRVIYENLKSMGGYLIEIGLKGTFTNFSGDLPFKFKSKKLTNFYLQI